MYSDDNDKRSKTRSQCTADNSLYISNLNILKILWSAATSMYQDSIILCVFLTNCALWDRCNKNT